LGPFQKFHQREFVLCEGENPKLPQNKRESSAVPVAVENGSSKNSSETSRVLLKSSYKVRRENNWRFIVSSYQYCCSKRSKSSASSNVLGSGVLFSCLIRCIRFSSAPLNPMTTSEHLKEENTFIDNKEYITFKCLSLLVLHLIEN
jgi:hypothetical protein